MANLFENVTTFFLGKKEDPREIETDNNETSFEKPNDVDGATVVSSSGGIHQSGMVSDGSKKNDKELIEIYRGISKIPEINEAIDEIVNEMISEDAEGKYIDLSLEELELSDAIKERIREEFEEILDVMGFDQRGHELVKRWYIDGRLALHKIVDKNKLKEGIKELRYINPASIEKVIEYTPVREGKVSLFKTTKEYFRYTPGNRTNSVSIKGTEKDNGSGQSFASSSFWADSGSIYGQNQVLAVSPEAIAYCTSGQYDEDFGCVTSYLHPAIKVANNLNMMEDALVIYRITRAPERRIFYVDTGSLPKTKGDQYVNDLMNKFKTNLTYDSVTGSVKDGRRFQSMMEDFWIPRRENGRNTEITTLQGGQNLGQLDDVEYFIKKLYSTLKIPYSRFNKEQPMMAGLGRSSEITRDEIRFQKFIDRLRKKFTLIFDDILGTQVVLKGIMKKAEWEQVKKNIKYRWATDNFYSELKESEMLRERLSTLQLADPYIGKYITPDYVFKSILCVPDEELDKLKKELDDIQATDQEEEQDQQFERGQMKNDLEADRMKKVLPIKQQFEGNEDE